MNGPQMTDWQLLREYAEHRSEPAFATLIERHMKLVYWTCRRGVDHAQLAEDATQAVFLLLAQKAGTIRSNTSIPGWLFQSARLVARNAARAERQRKFYEGEAAQQMTEYPSPELAFQEVEPWINEAISVLTPGERDVILLRYFGDLSFIEIAERIGTAENTASKRAAYALEKMRRHLKKRNVEVTSLVLTTHLAESCRKAAPESCFAAVTHSVHAVTVSSTACSADYPNLARLQKGVTLKMQAIKYRFAVAGAVIVLVVALVGWKAYSDRTSGPTFINLTTSSPTALDASNASGGDDQAIVSRLRQFTDAMNSHDADTVRALVSPDMIFHNLDGSSCNKDNFISGCRQTFSKYPGFRLVMKLESVSVNGDEAYTQVSETEGEGIVTTTVEGRIEWTKRNSAWLMKDMSPKPAVGTPNGTTTGN